MTQARKDENYVSTVIGVSSIDLSTPTLIGVNPITGAVLIDGTSLYTTLDTRYLLLAATNDPLTGVLTAPNYISTVATGTQPYAATSTTLNTNLNADLLDGNHASAFDVESVDLLSDLNVGLC